MPDKTDLEKRIHKSLIEDGFTENEFGTIICLQVDGTQVNLTLLIVEYIKAEA